MKKQAIPLRAVLGTITLVVCVLGVFQLQRLVEPEVRNYEYRFGEGQWRQGEHPLFVPAQDERMEVRFDYDLPWLYSSSAYLKPDDCLERIVINGIEVREPGIEFCDYTSLGELFALGEYLHPGVNTVEVQIRDHGGLAGFKITTRWIAGMPLAAYLGLLVIIAALGYWIVRLLPRQYWAAGYVFLGGTLLRVHYAATTSYTVRSHDVEAHIDYIEYIARHFTIPPAATGWEYHQAPLYYYLSGAWLWVLQAVGAAQETIIRHLQMGSLLVSVATLAVGLWIGFLLFSKKKQTTERTLFGLLIAFFPALVYLAPRITNNGLYHFFAFLTVAFLLQWWQKETFARWLRLVVAVAATIITKVSGLLFLPILATCLFVKWPLMIKKKGVTYGKLALSILLFIALVGWLPVVRSLERDATNSLTFGSQNMSPKLAVETTAKNLLTFNPIEVVAVTYNSPWSEEHRKEYFLEYFFKSAFFGEFIHAKALLPLGRLILISAMLLSPLLVFGLVYSERKHGLKDAPIILVALFLLLAQVAYRFHAPFGPNQDFRFSVLLIVPIAYYLVLGYSACKGNLRLISLALLLMHSVAAALFVALLPLLP